MLKIKVKEYKGYLAILLLIFLSSKTTILQDSNILLVIFFFIYLSSILKSNIIPKKTYYVVAVLFLLPIIYLFKFNSIQVYTFLGFILKFLLGYFIIILNKDKFIQNLIQVIYVMTFLGLPFFLLEQLVPDLTHALLKQATNFYKPLLFINEASGDFFSIFFYNTGERHYYRNAGFMWEPSAFAVILLIAICFNTVLNKNFFNKKNIIFLIALATTYSTTAFVLLPLAISPYIYRLIKKNILLMLISVFGFIVLFNFFVNSEVIGGKISEQIENPERGLEDQFIEYSKYGISGLSRFASIVVDYPKLIDNPILGLGVDLSITTINSIYTDWGKEYRRSNGLMLLLLKFGLLFSLIFFFFWYRGFLFITNEKITAMFILFLFIALGFSNDLILSPLFFTFISFGILNKKK